MNKVFTLSKYALLFICLCSYTIAKAQDFNIQHVQTDVGNTGVAGASGYAEVTSSAFTAVASTTNAFALPSSNRKTHAGPSSSSTVKEADDMAGATRLTAAGTLTYYRETGSISNAMRFNTSIWEYTGAPGGANEFIVRGRYVATLSAGGSGLGYTYADIDVSGAGIVTHNKVVPFITGIMNDDTNNGSDSGTAMAHLSSTSNLQVRKGTSSNNVSVYITLVEFTGSNWSVLHGNVGGTNANTGSITLYDGYDGTGTATDVSSWNNAIIFTHTKAQTAASGGVKEYISSQWPVMTPGTTPGLETRTVDWTFDSGRSTTGNASRHFVHVLDNSQMSITRITDTNSATNPTVNISSAGLSDINQSMIVGTSITSGSGSGYGRGWRNYYINSSNINEALHYAHRSGSTMNHNLQVVDFVTIPATTTQGPGGVVAEIELWLKANEGVEQAASVAAVDTDPVLNWLDNSTYGNDATQATGLNKPIFTVNSLNFNPTIDFDGTNHELLANTIANDSITIFVVGEGTYDGSTNNIVNHNNGGNGSVVIEQTGTTSLQGRYYDGTAASGIVSTTIADGTPFLVSYEHLAGGTSELFEDGISQGTASANTDNLSGTMTTYIGGHATTTKRWDGGIAEVVIYNQTLTTTEHDQVESYLALKYGFTLGVNGTSQDYVDSDNYAFWDQSNNIGYNYNVTGIGRDDDSGLEQKQSKTINTSDDITVGIKQIATTNEGNICEYFGDKSFLMWGHNNGSTTAGTDITKDFSSGIPGVSNSVSATPINRIWKMVVTDSVPTIKLSIPESMVSATNPGSEDYIMIISDDAAFTTNVTSATMEDVGTELEVEFYIEGTKYITFGSAPETLVNSGNGGAVTFDRADKYISAGNVNDLANKDYTISAWVKRDPGGGKFDVVSKRNYFNENTDLEPGPDVDGNYTHGYAFRINKTNQFRMVWRDPEDTKNQIMETYETIPENEWHQIAATHDFSENMTILYIDGIRVYDSDDFLADKGEPHNPMNTPSDAHFMIGAAQHLHRQQRLGGSVDEVRVWNVALTADQLRYIMNQEIEENVTLADGKVLPTSTTKNDIIAIPWNNLIAYYPMSTMVFGSIKDQSNSGNDASMINYDLLDEQTAPLPYKSIADGPWDSSTTWENGDVQYLPGVTSYLTTDYDFDDDGDIDDDDKRTIDYNIVQIDNDVTMDNTDTDLIPTYKEENRTVLGLVVNSNNELSLDGSTNDGEGNGITITHYLELNGEIDLEGESQLLQPTFSDLVVGTYGKLYRDQQGTADTYTYNYWSSPVGTTDIGTTEHRYTLPDILKDGTLDVDFTASGYDGSSGTPIEIADYWIWKFADQPDDDYSAWQHVRSSGTIDAGEGFTMKGPGTGSITDNQDYTFAGKPNNGDIDLNISSGSDYLIGNPYPSAIDAYTFINDNSSAITGTLYFWEHWGGGSHLLADYQGGYHVLNLSGVTTAATQGTNDPDVGTGGTPLKTPGNYIPVSQGFFVVADADGGTISFKNRQRVFQKESDGNSEMVGMNDETGKVSLGSNNENNYTNISDTEDTRLKLRIGFNSINTIRRQLLATLDPNASEGVDWGYDGKHNESQIDDMYWLIDNEKFVIQGTNTIGSQTIFPIGIYTDNDGLNSIVLDTLENAPENMDVFLHDKELDIYHNLNESDYEIFLLAGTYNNRFEITFNNPNLDSLGIDDNEHSKINVYYSNVTESIVLLNPTLLNIKSIEVTNILGQKVHTINNIPNVEYKEIEVRNLSSGAYIIKLNTNNGIISKKVLVK